MDPISTPTAQAEGQLPLLLTLEQLHDAYQGAIGINHLRKLVEQGRIKSVLVGVKKRLIPRAEVAEWPLREAERGN